MHKKPVTFAPYPVQMCQARQDDWQCGIAHSSLSGSHLPCRELLFLPVSQPITVSKIVHHTTQIINTIGVWNKGMPRLSFTHFFSTTMMKSDVRYNINYIFSIKLYYQTKKTMSARMLRPRLRNIKSLSSLVLSNPYSAGSNLRFESSSSLIYRENEWINLSRPCMMFLS